MNFRLVVVFSVFLGNCYCDLSDPSLCRRIYQFCEDQPETEDSSCCAIGPEGPAGEPGVVDYEIVNRTVSAKLEDLDNKVEARLSTLEYKLEACMQRMFELAGIVQRITATTQEPAPTPAPDRSSWHRANNGYLYKLFLTKPTYAEAKIICQNYDARIASKSLQDSTFVRQLFSDMGVNGLIWLGLTDLEQEGVFVWDDGTPLGSPNVNWSAGEPNDYRGGEDCSYYFKVGSNWAVNDTPCNERHFYFICETRS